MATKTPSKAPINSPVAVTLEQVRAKLAAGETVSATEFATAKASVEFDRFATDIRDEAAAQAATAELEERRAGFTARVLADAVLTDTGAVRRLGDELRATISAGLVTYRDQLQRRDAAILAAIAEARTLGLVDDADQPVGYHTSGTSRGLRVNGRKVELGGGWHQGAQRAAADALAELYRASR